MTFTVLVCLVGSVYAQSCCFQSDCNENEYCNSRKGCRFSRRRRGTCVAKRLHGEEVPRRLLSYAYSKCVSGTGACGFCSSTCKTEEGCRVVPERTFDVINVLFILAKSTPLCLFAGGACSQNSDCLEGLYCDSGTDFLTFGCQGVCLRKLWV